MAESKNQIDPQPKPSSPREIRTIDARELFHEEREICIEHEGVRYRLRITRKNRLILQK